MNRDFQGPHIGSQFRCRFGKRLILKPHQQDRLPLRFGKLRQGVAQGLHLIHGFLIAIRRQAVGGYIEIIDGDFVFARRVWRRSPSSSRWRTMAASQGLNGRAGS